MKKIYLNTLTPEEIIKRLKDGEIIHQVDEGYKTKMIDGVICEFVGEEMVVFNKQLHINECDFKDLYFEEPEELNIEKDGKYKTRDGRIAWVSDIYDNNNDGYFCRGIITGDTEITEWGLNGKLLGTLENVSDEDLVEYVGD